MATAKPDKREKIAGATLRGAVTDRPSPRAGRPEK